MLFVVEYVLLHFDHFKQVFSFGFPQFLVTFQDFSQPRIGTSSTSGLEREQIWSLSRERSTLLFPTVILPAQLPSCPVKRERKHVWESSGSCWLHPEAWSWQAECSLGSGGSLTAGILSERKRQCKHQNNTEIPNVKWSSVLL